MDKGTNEPFAGKGCQKVLTTLDEFHISQGQKHQLVNIAVTLVDPAQGNKRAIILVMRCGLHAPDEEILLPGHMLE
jgi:hypothetical protein